MSIKVILPSLFEAIAVILLLVGFVNEKKIIRWEQEMLELLHEARVAWSNSTLSVKAKLKVLTYCLFTDKTVQEIRNAVGIVSNAPVAEEKPEIYSEIISVRTIPCSYSDIAYFTERDVFKYITVQTFCDTNAKVNLNAVKSKIGEPVKLLAEDETLGALIPDELLDKTAECGVYIKDKPAYYALQHIENPA